MKTWETTIEETTCSGRVTADPVSIEREILQGDSFFFFSIKLIE